MTVLIFSPYLPDELYMRVCVGVAFCAGELIYQVPSSRMKYVLFFCLYKNYFVAETPEGVPALQQHTNHYLLNQYKAATEYRKQGAHLNKLNFLTLW